MAKKQALLLCPTTVLCEQHYQTALERFSQWPVRIGIISRLKASTENTRVLAHFKKGSIDVLITTHGILSLDEPIRELGVIIIDEEHRFGVEAKERLLTMHPFAHRLCVSATPIPRTLQSAFHHLKEISFIQKPPKMRLEVKTIVTPYNEDTIIMAITREISRGGQVFFIHNDINSHSTITDFLLEHFPLLSIVAIHGNLAKNQLENIMRDFSKGQHHILISTTLIESGIDIPNANTIIINRADMLGLAQLHQLRGRVGRSNHQAYAYLLYPEGLKDNDASKRLEALDTHSGLGSGWMLAIKDLEIRGAGSLLGKEQSGHVDDIGYGLYQKLLNDALENLQPSPQALTTLSCDLGLERYIPAHYIPDMTERMQIYSSVYNAQNTDELQTLCSQLIDRYGPLPLPAKQLLNQHYFILITRNAGLTSILKQKNTILWTWQDDAQLNKDVLFSWFNEKKFQLTFTKNMSFTIQLETDILESCIDIFIALTSLKA